MELTVELEPHGSNPIPVANARSCEWSSNPADLAMIAAAASSGGYLPTTCRIEEVPGSRAPRDGRHRLTRARGSVSGGV